MSADAQRLAEPAPLDASLEGGLDLCAMAPGHLAVIAEVEKTAYGHPWTRRHFDDSLRAGYLGWVLVRERDAAGAADLAPCLPDGRQLLAYLVAMSVLDEVHLLNLTTVPAQQRRGWGRLMLQSLVTWSRARGAQCLWLEVRASNVAALALYRREDFREVGRRRDYYPAGAQRREDAVVMSRALWPETREVAA